VAYLLEVFDDFLKWNVNFLRVAYDWEVDSFTLFLNLLYFFRLSRGSENKLY
jgi:hypothetical protein